MLSAVKASATRPRDGGWRLSCPSAIKSGATTNESSAVYLGTASGYVAGRWETDPNTSSAWTQSGVNALEAGATIR